jgi:hypothetical protein
MSEPKRNRGWIWYFVILIILTITAITVMIVYNMGQQLKPEQLATARALWAEKGPANYDMEFTQVGSAPGTFQVQVRDGEIVSATMDGRPLERPQYRYYDMRGLFNSIDGFLEHDSKPGQPRTFTKAVFAADDGHVVKYIRRVMGSQERLEINVKLRPVEKSGGSLADRPATGDNRP